MEKGTLHFIYSIELTTKDIASLYHEACEEDWDGGERDRKTERERERDPKSISDFPWLRVDLDN